MGFGSGHELSGGLAEYCVLAAGTHTIKLPDAARLEVFTPASCATATVMAALETLRTPPTDNSHIAIHRGWNARFDRLRSIQNARLETRRSNRPYAEKREMALRFGATHAFSPEAWQVTWNQTETMAATR